jgi:hypothetical protein
MRKTLGLLAALLLTLAAAGCGASGGTSDGSGSTTAPSGGGDGTTTTAGGGEPTTTEGGDDTTTTTGGGSSGADAEYIDALTVGFTSGEDGDLVLPDDQAACVAEAWIDIIGTDTIDEADFSVSDLEDPDFNWDQLGLESSQGEDLVDAFGDCGYDIYAALDEVLLGGLEDDQKACLQKELDEAFARDLLVDNLIHEDPTPAIEAEQKRIDELCKLGA